MEVVTITVAAMDIGELDYALPPELIAQHPAARRDGSRLLVYERATGDVRHRRFSDLADELRNELVVVNDTRVVPARIPIDVAARRGAAARAHRRRHMGRAGAADAAAQAGHALWPGRADRASRRRPLAAATDGEPHGETPLPPYITEPLADPARYQTVYARDAGSAAAPTAGLHFTPELLAQLDVERVTLHVGLDTFRPVTEDRLEEHVIHGERYSVDPAAWQRIANAERVLAVGTTTVRVLETLARGNAARRPHRALHHARLRVPPRRRAPDELPPAALDAARARHGVRRSRRDRGASTKRRCEERYRFYSFGDAMLIL